jgi:hypothetical protein
MKKIFLLVFLCCIFHGLSAQPVPADTTVKPIADTVAKAVVDSADLYGYSKERPILVGGGPAQQRAYLESLRDAQGKRISYVRKGSCCPYPTNSPSAMFGGGMLDVYEITYRDADDNPKKVNVFISFYDYEEPKPIKGFRFR